MPRDEINVAHDILIGGKTTIFVIEGRTGEYSDRVEWSVAAYLRKEDADAYLAQLEAWLLENKVHAELEGQGRLIGYQSRLRRLLAYNKLTCPLDPNFQSDYTGVEYYIVEISYGPPR